jgi:hypothetical protein
VTLPENLLAHLGIRPGDKIAVEKLPDGWIEAKAVRPVGRIFDVFRFLRLQNRPSLSLDEMN